METLEILYDFGIMPEAQKRGISLLDVLSEVTKQSSDIAEVFKKIPEETLYLLRNPEKYTGYAKEKANEISREISHIFLSDE